MKIPATNGRKLAAILLIAFGASQAGAAVIYDGGAPNLGNVYLADTSFTFTTAAEDFVLKPGATTVTDAHWWGACFGGSNSCPAGNFVIGFYNDDTGAPGSLIKQYIVGNANQTATGNFIFSATEYAYSADFGPLALAAATKYWFTVSNTTLRELWGMETTGPGSHRQFRTGTGTGWTLQDQNLAFNLTNDRASIPEPASFALLSLGLVGLGALRRRKG
ncbi:PEP-CTERM sorting domain-containing protein [Candidatus Accumulibacter vicinus]|uniref:PEP-CTERM motif protein n=1 Tax=Candidatus Accumulibacter vicinus TaxID=2954382 RepID=A0A084Y2K0_9PROT|nr:PEP-CTERM sorting domain-containing protein [Candidatus Accumulibacter vicinus]KFB68944.1 MAG: PEP-CTERM motif protein [Candidatus Accumulibacter vicinus]